jgi:chromosome partitioning protein
MSKENQENTTEQSFGSIWTIANTKGGVGKSTATTNIAVVLAEMGFKVRIVDGDPNPTAGSGVWHKKREAQIASLKEQGVDISLVDVDCTKTSGDICESVRSYAARYDYVLVDTAGLSSSEFSSAGATSHLIIVPTECDVYSAESAEVGFSGGSMEEMNSNIKKVLMMNRNCKSVSFINKAPTRAGATQRKETRDFLSKFSHLKPCKNSISYYEKIYGEAASLGASVVEMTHQKAKAQYQLLVDELIAIDSGE